ncbi:FAD/NAD(P)-binding oxidoreductase [Pseudoflavonifractor phocaeensis]|uniref:NAD(P)/FAD-dependent oxidoreductase n=1 Tax=Pseudoflavonifractor phocaeensis TaxID=1870988 RepID=UPI00313CCAC3
MKRFAIIGFGCAGYQALAAIRQAGCGAQVDVYTETDLPPYNPMLTTYYVGGKLPYEGLFPFGTLEEIGQRYEASFLTGTRAAKVDAQRRTVTLESGEVRSYDKILVSTGATAFVPPSFAGVEGAFCMRTVDDAVGLKTALEEREYRSAVVVGASMVGIKVAELLLKRGIRVTLADMAPHIFALAAYPEVSAMIEERIDKMGIRMAFSRALAGAEKTPEGYRVTFADGETLDTDLLVLNIGTRAATGLLDPAQVNIDRGVVVNERMETSAPGVYAAGDCCQGRNLQSGQTQIIGLWANAGVQGRVAGRNMAGVGDETDGNILHNITHFLDMDFIGLGDNRATGEVYQYYSPDRRFYLQAVLKDGWPVGFNILDNYGISGILKAHLVKVLRGEKSGFTPEQRGQLLRYGLEGDFIDTLEGMV